MKKTARRRAGRGTRTGLPPGVRAPYDWALRQLRVRKAHAITRGSRDVIVAVIDLGYRHHPDLDGHLWKNPRPRRGDVHGWDFADNDASLEYRGEDPESAYHLGHHVFVAGEVAAVAPQCPIMILRVGYDSPGSWTPAIRYAADHGARVLVVPHGYIQGAMATGVPFFYQGVDFGFPFDNTALLEAMEYARRQGCLIVSGTADNRGRRVAVVACAVDAAFAVGSSNRCDAPADICCSADYVQAGAPGGDRKTGRAADQIWGCGGARNYIPFTGGCMAAGFAGGVAALAWSKHPTLSPDALRQLLRNTARPAHGVVADDDGWEPRLGYGILDAARAVSIHSDEVQCSVCALAESGRVIRRKGQCILTVRVRNAGALDARRALMVAFNGDPSRPADRSGTLAKSAPILQVKQIGHAIASIRGLHERSVAIALTDPPVGDVWLETCCLDSGCARGLHRTRLRLP